MKIQSKSFRGQNYESNMTDWFKENLDVKIINIETVNNGPLGSYFKIWYFKES